MDVDVVLNACLETYQESEIQRARDAARIRQMQQEVITKSMTSRLFGTDGEVICDISELTISQSRPIIPMYDVWSRLSVYTIPGKLDVTGSFFATWNGSNLTQVRDQANYYIETDQLYSDGSSSRVRILNVDIVDCRAQTNNRVDYMYRATRVEHITMRRE